MEKKPRLARGLDALLGAGLPDPEPILAGSSEVPLAAIETNLEPALWAHVRKFSWALVGVLARRRAARSS